MRIAILADIHGNYEALTAVLEDISTQKIDKILCLGDIWGYGINPSPCHALCKQVCESVLLGEHDLAVVKTNLIVYFGSLIVSEILRWHSEIISGPEKDDITLFPSALIIENLFLLHGYFQLEKLPQNKSRWVLYYSNDTLSTEEHIRDNQSFKIFDPPKAIWHANGKIIEIPDNYIIVGGHSHSPMHYKDGFSRPCPNNYSLAFKGVKVVDVGSVGQPRDQNPKACYMIADLAKRNFFWRRVKYDVDNAILQIKQCHYLKEKLGDLTVFAERLRQGI